MIIVGLTGGIASGKTTIKNFIKKKNIPVHDSDECVSMLYKKPTDKFLCYLKSINLKSSITKKNIDKKKIRAKVYTNITILKKLEKFIHLEVRILRDKFLKKNKLLGKKMVVLDIPLLFENHPTFTYLMVNIDKVQPP